MALRRPRPAGPARAKSNLMVHTHTHARTHTLSLSFSLSLPHTRTLSLSLSIALSLSLSHTHTHTHTHALCLEGYHAPEGTPPSQPSPQRNEQQDSMSSADRSCRPWHITLWQTGQNLALSQDVRGTSWLSASLWRVERENTTDLCALIVLYVPYSRTWHIQDSQGQILALTFRFP